MANDFLWLGENIQTIRNEFLKNDNIVKLLAYNDAFALEKPTLENPFELIDAGKLNIFPYVNKLTEEKISYISITTGNIYKGQYNSGFRNVQLIVSVVSHSGIWETKNGLRPILLVNEVDNVLNRNKKIRSLGGLSFEACYTCHHNNAFYGFELIYNFTGFNG